MIGNQDRVGDNNPVAALGVRAVKVTGPGGKRQSRALRGPTHATLLLLALALVAACRGATPPATNRWRLALSPASLAQTISLQQHVQVEQGSHNVDFEAVLDVTPEMVTLVGLAFNQRVFTLKYDGVKLQESRSKMLPREVQAGDVLSDLQLALWPTEVVRSALPTGWTLRDSSGTRVLSESDTVRTTITYSAVPRWTGTINLQNKQFDYRLVIRSAAAN